MRCNRKIDGFTRKDLIVTVAVFAVLTLLLLVPASQREREKAKRISCICSLKQIGTAYRVWENDRGDRYPDNASVTNGGWNEILTTTNVSVYCWTNYAILSNELGEATRILACPSDERKPAKSFSELANTNLSYFVGVGTRDTDPQSVLGGDRNLGPGTTPQDDYGYSPDDGRGNDVKVTGPVCWSLKMHSRGISAGGGNIMLGDGSAQQTTSDGLRDTWITNSLPLRLIFP